MSQAHQQHEQLQRRRRRRWEQQQQQQRCRQSAELCECLRPVIRVFGLLTSFVICGVGVDVYMHGYQAGLYILFSALLVLFIEIKWLINIFLQLQCDDDNYHNTGCLNCWRFSDLLGNWRPAPLYVTMGVALMLYPHNLWLSYVAGMLLLLLALLRLGTLLPLGGHTTSPHKEEGLLPQCDFEKVSSFVDSVEDDFAEVSVSQPDDDEAPIDDDVC